MSELASVLICTRNRPADAERAVRSVLASRDVKLDVIVIDQSDGDETRERLESLGADGALRYHRSRRRGVGPALTEGLRVARAAYILRTDDDCTVRPDWAAGMVRALQARPGVGLVFSNVVAAPFDASAGYTPECVRDRDEMIRTVFGTLRHRGLGAAVAFRRDALEEIGGFDPALGPGTPHPAGEDWDVELRMLLRNWHVYHASEIEVVHFGFRSFSDGKVHARRDWFGIGALFAKLIRCGRLSVVPVAVWQLLAYGVAPPLNDLAHFRRPRGIGRITAFFGGFAAALRVPIDRHTMRFIDPDSTESEPRTAARTRRRHALARISGWTRQTIEALSRHKVLLIAPLAVTLLLTT
jgi:GT2 family glycosyltransferase